MNFLRKYRSHIVFSILIPLFCWAYLDLTSQESIICTLPVGQPGLSDACARYGMGGRPSREERLAWEALPAGQCAALRRHVEHYPDGAFRDDAAQLIATRRVEIVENWHERAVVTPLYSPLNLRPTSPDEANAQAMRNAEGFAASNCESLAQNDGFRLISTQINNAETFCEAVSGGWFCRVEGQTVCLVEQRSYVEIEKCG